MIRESDIAARNVSSRNTCYTPLKLRSNCTCSLAQEAVQIDMNGAGGGDRPAGHVVRRTSSRLGKLSIMPTHYNEKKDNPMGYLFIKCCL